EVRLSSNNPELRAGPGLALKGILGSSLSYRPIRPRWRFGLVSTLSSFFMSQDNGSGRNRDRDRDGEGRGPSALSVLLWVSLVSLVILLGYGQVISMFRVELSPSDLQ